MHVMAAWLICCQVLLAQFLTLLKQLFKAYLSTQPSHIWVVPRIGIHLMSSELESPSMYLVLGNRWYSTNKPNY